MPKRRKLHKSELLEGAVEWVLENGVSALSLRPLAAVLGTSARMLVYHFGSKDELVQDVLDEIARRWDARLAERLDHGTTAALSVAVLWREILLAPEQDRLSLAALEAWTVGLATGAGVYQPFVRRVAHGWTSLLREAWMGEGVPSQDAQGRALLVVAALQGLLLHRLAEPDTPIDAAFGRLMTCMRA